MWGREVKRQHFGTQLKLSCHQLKINCYVYVLCKVHGNHIAKTYNRYITVKERRIKAYITGNHQFTKKAREEERTMELQKSQKNNNKMALVSPYPSTVILNINGLNSPVKRQRSWIFFKKDPTKCSLQKTHFRFKDTYRLKVKGKKNIS